MSTEKTPAQILAELEEKVAAKKLAVQGEDAETQRKIENAKADLEYLELQERFNALGKQDEKYSIVDVTAHGRGFVVVVLDAKAEMHKKMITHAAKGEDAAFNMKAAEITRDCVKHPPIEAYTALVAEVPSVADLCFLAVQDLWGARAKIRRGK